MGGLGEKLSLRVDDYRASHAVFAVDYSFNLVGLCMHSR